MARDLDTARLTLKIAELLDRMACQLDDDPEAYEGLAEELHRQLREAEIIARRWHMIAAIDVGLIELPDIEAFGDETREEFGD